MHLDSKSVVPEILAPILREDEERPHTDTYNHMCNSDDIIEYCDVYTVGPRDGVSTPCGLNKGVLVESLRSPHGVYEDSIRNQKISCQCINFIHSGQDLYYIKKPKKD
jgi:hypothetical protein